MAKRALITGLNGFIGRHLWDALADQGIEPIALDRHDLYIEVPQLTEILFHHKPNYIFHLASYGNHRKQTDVTQAIMANYFATYNLLKASEFLEYEAFINVASSSCYGVKRGLMGEDDSMWPDTFYAATKVGGLQLARAFTKQYDKPIVTVIPFSVYGEGEADHRFIPTVARHLITQDSMSINKAQTHDWIYVSDFINGLLLAIDKIDTLKGDLLNIGTGITTSNGDVAETLIKASKKNLSLKDDFKGNTFDSPYWCSNNEKLKKLGWQQKVSLEQGLAKCWDYYSKIYA